MTTPAFRASYAATRLQGVVHMLQDANHIGDLQDALGHLDTVYREIMREAAKTETYGWGVGLPQQP